MAMASTLVLSFSKICLTFLTFNLILEIIRKLFLDKRRRKKLYQADEYITDLGVIEGRRRAKWALHERGLKVWALLGLGILVPSSIAEVLATRLRSLFMGSVAGFYAGMPQFAVCFASWLEKLGLSFLVVPPVLFVSGLFVKKFRFWYGLVGGRGRSSTSDRNAATSAGTTRSQRRVRGPLPRTRSLWATSTTRRGELRTRSEELRAGPLRQELQASVGQPPRGQSQEGIVHAEEEMLILQLHAQLGNKWARMGRELPGRTDNEIKNLLEHEGQEAAEAGLPLYPNEIRQQAAARTRPSPLNLPSSTSPAAMPLLFCAGRSKNEGGVGFDAAGRRRTGNMFHEYGYDGSGGGSYNETPRSSLMTPIIRRDGEDASSLHTNCLMPALAALRTGAGCWMRWLEETGVSEGSARREMVVALSQS
ncbi:uncharacterized protein A4U43_C03F11800 [Asparagus officinalis]|uniref:HTH myb-type domain-containing protein n=1 Tax=Asparagus officinalis TaxID=4686 RepID=A0A5P1FB30_ASPOF|nr:uncharacterized protein A4U43_C03F11800 [Asparagus officinalis]